MPLKLDHLSKSTGILMSGTALGQAILLLSLPLLTRIYTPEEFNTLAIYVAIVGLFSGAACLRFDIALSIPASREESQKLLSLSILCAASVSVAVALGVWLVGWLFEIDYTLDREVFSLLVGAGLFSIGTFNALQIWYVREQNFLTISLVKFFQATASVLIQITLGILGIKTAGLVLGFIANSAIGGTFLSLRSHHGARPFKVLPLKEIKRLFGTYSRFPKYSAIESLANEGASQIPLLLIAFILGGAEAGFLMLAVRVLQAPIGLVGNAVSQVYLSQAPRREREGQLADFSVNMIVRLAKLGVGPLIVAGMLAPFAFPIIFGSEWERSGQLISWMTPWFILQFLVSPVSMSLHIKGQQSVALNLQIFSLIFRVSVVAFCFLAIPEVTVEAYALSGCVVYLAYLLVVLKALQVPASTLLKALRVATPPIMMSFSIAISLVLLITYLDGLPRGIISE